MKKVLQQTLFRLKTFLLLAVMFIVGSSAAWAEESVTFTFYLKESPQITNGIKIEYYGYNNTYEGYEEYATAELYGDTRIMTVSSEECIIKRIELTRTTFYGNNYDWRSFSPSVGTYSVSQYDATAYWTSPEEGCESVTFKARDVYLSSVTVYYEIKQIAPIDYTVNFTGDVPTGCSASYGDDTFTSSGTFSVAKNLKEEDLNITTTADYYADVTYNESEHSWNIEFKHYYYYNFVIEGSDDGYITNTSDWRNYFDGGQLKVKVALTESDFEAYDVNGYDESAVTFEAVDEYTTNVKVTYTESAVKPYTVTFPENTPDGVRVTVYVGYNPLTFTESGTFQTNLELRPNDFQVTTPATHWYEDVWNCYDSETHTFTVKVHENLQYTVAVEGTDDVNAGVMYNSTPYHVGDIIYTRDELYTNSVNAISIDGLEAFVSLEDKAFTVTYKKPAYYVFDTTTNSSGNKTIDLNQGGVHLTATGWNYKLDFYHGQPVVISCEEAFIDKVVFVYSGTLPTMECSTGSFDCSTNTWSIGSSEPTNRVSIEYTGWSDYLVSEVRVWIKEIEPTPAPEFPKEGVAYAIKNVGLGLYVNVKEHATEAGYVSAEKEKLFFTWDEKKAAFTIKDEDGNYLGKSTANGWNMNSKDPDYWTLEEISAGVYAFKSKSSKYLAPNSNTDYRLMRDKDSNYNYTFTLEEYAAPTTYTVIFSDGAPAGASVTIDGNTYTESTTFTVAKVLDENSVTAVADVEGYEHSYAYDDEDKEFTITYTALPAYEYYVDIYPANDKSLKVIIDGKECGVGDYTFYKVITLADIETPKYDGYYPNPSVDIDDDLGFITVEYKPLPSLAIGSSASDSEGNYWTSFCLDKAVSFPADVTPCIVTGAENGKLQVEELKGAAGESTYKGLDATMIANGWANIIINENDELSPSITGSYFDFSDYQIHIASESANVTFHAPAGYVITSIRPIYDEQYYAIQWPDGSVNGNYEGPAAAEVNARFYNSNGEGWWYVNGFYIFIAELGTPVIPANTGILVKSDAPAYKIVYIVHEEGVETVDVSANILQASGETGFNVSNDADNLYYKLTLNAAGEAGTAGFYWDKNSDEGHSISVPAHKAYLKLPVSAGSNRAVYHFGGEDVLTGVESISTEADNAPVYNLQGQRVNATKAGVYVKNGKKFIVK